MISGIPCSARNDKGGLAQNYLSFRATGEEPRRSSGRSQELISEFPFFGSTEHKILSQSHRVQEWSLAMQRDMFTWVFTGISVMMIIGICVMLRQHTKQEQSSPIPTYRASALRIPANVSIVSLRGKPLVCAFSDDAQRVYLAYTNAGMIESREYTVANKTERTLARLQVPNSQSVGRIAIGKNGQVVALLTTDSDSQPTRTRVRVIPPRGRAKTITHRTTNDCSIEAVAENGAAIAGRYTRTVSRSPFEQIETPRPLLKVDPRLYQAPAPLIEHTSPGGLRLSQPYSADSLAEPTYVPEKPSSEFFRRPSYRIRYHQHLRSFPRININPSGGEPPDYDPLDHLPDYNRFTYTEVYLFCSARGRMHSIKVDWNGEPMVVGVSDSGKTVAGNYFHSNQQQGFIWRVGKSLSTIKYPGSQRTQLFWLSPRGDTVLGLAAVSDTKTLLFRWSRRAGYKRLGEIPESIESVSVHCVAPNGQAVLLGLSAYYADPIYFVWSEQLGFRKSEQLSDMLTEPLCLSNSGKQILAGTKWGLAIVKVE